MRIKVPEGDERDFVASALTLKDGKVLLIDHVKHGVWLPPGGHVDPGETPDETAKRETLEETGFIVEIEGKQQKVEEGYFDRPRPFHVNLHRVREDHWHCDFLYVAEIISEGEATHGYEHDGTRWFSKNDLEDRSFEIPEYIRDAGKRAISSQEG